MILHDLKCPAPVRDTIPTARPASTGRRRPAERWRWRVRKAGSCVALGCGYTPSAT